MIDDKIRQEIYSAGYRDGFANALKSFDTFLKWLKKGRNTYTCTTTTNLSNEEIWEQIINPH